MEVSVGITTFEAGFLDRQDQNSLVAVCHFCVPVVTLQS